MSGRRQLLHTLPPSVLWDFCRVMDALSDLDWTQFASEVLGDQTELRLAERRERRTDWVMNQWGNRNGRVGELIDLLERLQLLRPRDVILSGMSSLTPAPSLPAAPPPRPDVSLSRFDPPPKPCPPPSEAPPTQTTLQLVTSGPSCCLRPTGPGPDSPGLPPGPLPGPSPPPSRLQQSELHPPPQAPPAPAVSCGVGGGVMCWSYEEVALATDNFSPSCQVGEGGFGVVYRATVTNTECAVKRLKQDVLGDWTQLRASFMTEVENLSKFRHTNIVELLGFSEGGGSVCLIYSYMCKGSLDQQLHNQQVVLSWGLRVSVVKDVSTALQFLHCPPGDKPLIHGDVKSSNILLDRHLVAKLADFGLSRLVPTGGSEGRSAAQTASVGKTETVRGTLAYLPDEYVRNKELGTAVDVYSFGVVLLEVLTGRRALETDRKCRDRYLKDLVDEVADGPGGSSPEAWRKQLDKRLVSGGGTEPVGCLDMVFLACSCLDRKRKKRPKMTEVFKKLQNIHHQVKTSSSSHLNHPPPPHPHPSSPPLPHPPRSQDYSEVSLSDQFSKLGPLEVTYQPPLSSSSSFRALTPPYPLHSSSSSSSSFAGPCETDESQGFSQYHLQSGSDRTSSRSLSPSCRDQYCRPAQSCFREPSVPTEDQYTGSRIFTGSRVVTGSRILTGPGIHREPDTRGQTSTGACRVPECLSPGGLLQSSSPGPSIQVNPCKQRLLEKTRLYEDGQIQTPELLSSHDLYRGRTSDASRRPEESDELDYLPSTHR